VDYKRAIRNIELTTTLILLAGVGVGIVLTLEKEQIAVVTGIITTIGFVCGAFYIDQRLLGCRNSTRMVLALILLSIGIWLITVHPLALWLQVPGSYGPVQFWVDAPGRGMGFMHVRILGMFLTLGGVWVAVAVSIATITGLFLESSVPKWRRCLIPGIGLAVYATAYYMFFHYGFSPSA